MRKSASRILKTCNVFPENDHIKKTLAVYKVTEP